MCKPHGYSMGMVKPSHIVLVIREDAVLDFEEAGLMVRLHVLEKHVYKYIPLHLEEVYHT